VQFTRHGNGNRYHRDKPGGSRHSVSSRHSPYSRASSTRIGSNDYKTLVAEKLKTAGELYEFMVAQFNERRMFVVEVVVAILVLLDVILLLRGNK